MIENISRVSIQTGDHHDRCQYRENSQRELRPAYDTCPARSKQEKQRGMIRGCIVKLS